MSRRSISIDTAREPLALDQGEEPLDWERLFGNDLPVELEVGPGKGLFLLNAGLRNPGVNYVGVEISRKFARVAADQVAKHGLPNVRVIHGDVRVFLERFAPPQSLQKAHVYFPDPWWKKRHQKRRVFSEAFLDQLERRLRPSGEIWFTTDVEGYFEEIVALLDARSTFERLPPVEPSAPEHDHDYLTNFERKYRLEGRPIHRGRYRLAIANASETPPGPSGTNV